MRVRVAGRQWSLCRSLTETARLLHNVRSVFSRRSTRAQTELELSREYRTARVLDASHLHLSTLICRLVAQVINHTAAGRAAPLATFSRTTYWILDTVCVSPHDSLSVIDTLIYHQFIFLLSSRQFAIFKI